MRHQMGPWFLKWLEALVSDPRLFVCHLCGVDTNTAPDPPDLAVCEDCCEDHDYRYEREERGHFCTHCCRRRPDEWDDDL